MATTRNSPSYRVNVTMSKEEHALLEHIAEIEDRQVGYVAVFFMRWGLRQYKNLGMTLMQMKNADCFDDVKASKITSKIRLKLREEMSATNNNGVD